MLLKTVMRSVYFSSSSTKTAPLFAYNEKLQGVLSRHRNPSEEKKPVKACEKLKSHELEVSESQTERTKPLDFRLNEAESVRKASSEKADTDSKKDNSPESSKRLSLPKATQVISVFGLSDFDETSHRNKKLYIKIIQV